MSDKINSITIVFDKDISEEYAEMVMSALKLYDGVIGVNSNVTNIDAHMAQSRAKTAMLNKILEAFNI